MKQLLNGKWTLAFAPERGGQSDSYSPALTAAWSEIPALVPGNVELALVDAGLMPDPFYADNIHLYAPYEYYQWVYERRFTVDTTQLPQAPAHADEMLFTVAMHPVLKKLLTWW